MVDPSKVWHLTFLGLAYPYLLLGNLLFAVYWAAKRHRYAIFPVGCILVGAGYLSSSFGFRFFSSSDQNGGEIKVMSYNTAAFKSFVKNSEQEKTAKAAALADLAAAHGIPDIFCAQECDPSAVVEVIRRVFGYKHYFKEKGTVIFSKFQIEDHGIVPFEGTSNSCIWADLRTPKGIFRVYSVHLQSNRLTKTATRIATEGDLREKETWRDIGFVMRRYKQAVGIRARQARAVAKHLSKSPHPVILCGDLNDTPVSYVHRLFTQALQDSFREAGSGIGSTYAGKLPGLRIDYVMASPGATFRSHQVLRSGLSDHYPVLVSILP